MMGTMRARWRVRVLCHPSPTNAQEKQQVVQGQDQDQDQDQQDEGTIDELAKEIQRAECIVEGLLG